MKETKVICDMCKQEIMDKNSCTFTFDELAPMSIKSCIYLDLCENCLKKMLRLLGKNEDHFSKKRR